MTWNYQNTQFDQDITHLCGFVYSITSNYGRTYIGKKNFYQYRTPKGKKNKVRSESNWKEYWSSCNELKLDVKRFGKEYFHRDILILCTSKIHMTYTETALQFKLDVLRDDSYYNSNINGKYYQWFDTD